MIALMGYAKQIMALMRVRGKQTDDDPALFGLSSIEKAYNLRIMLYSIFQAVQTVSCCSCYE